MTLSNECSISIINISYLIVVCIHYLNTYNIFTAVSHLIVIACLLCLSTVVFSQPSLVPVY